MKTRQTGFYRLILAGLLIGSVACIGSPDSILPGGIVPFPTSVDTDGGSTSTTTSNTDSSVDTGTGDGTTTDNDADSQSPTPSTVSDQTTTAACIGSDQPSTATHIAMFDALNFYRIQNGLSPLIYSQRLEDAADAHVQDLWQRDFFDHINPDGKDPGDRALDAGFCHHYVGENIAAGQTSVQSVMNAWEKSPSHNANMLEEDYKYVGMGVFTDPDGRIYWAQEFAFDVPDL